MAQWTYEKQKELQRTKNREQSQTGRDIAPDFPRVKNARRKNSCRLNLRKFCETYFKNVFNLAWSPDHLTVIERLQDAILNGGTFALAMARGTGKTTLVNVAAIWAKVYGHRFFTVIIGATAAKALDNLDTIKSALETNDMLLQDFPEVCYPIKRIEGITKRCVGQLYKGEPTRMKLNRDTLVLPTIKGSVASGSCIRVAGITGSVRGLSITRVSDGTTIRPDLVLIDDPQTDESANSLPQIRRRLSTITGAILGLAGPKKKIAGVMPCTVIQKGDVADQVLNQKQHPEWQGVRFRLLKTLPTAVKEWEQYAELRAQGLREGTGLKGATAYYRDNRSVMDAGAEASWASRFNNDEISAIQNAMNLKLMSEEAFWAEYQNEPLALDLGDSLTLTPEVVQAKATDLKRSLVPLQCSKLTAFIDVQGSVLFYAVCAWDSDFGGAVVEYGTFPDQQRVYFTIRDIAPTLQSVTGKSVPEAQIYEGLAGLTDSLLTRQWNYEVGSGKEPLRIERIFIDSGYMSTTVEQFSRETKHRALILPTKGRGITADNKPMLQYEKRTGERLGWNWRLMTAPQKRVEYDTNEWKTFIAKRLMLPLGAVGGISLFQASQTQHRLFSEHLSAEYSVPTEGYGRVVNVWKSKPNRENHWLDCIVGAAVAASEQGVLAVGHSPQSNPQRKRRKYEVSF